MANDVREDQSEREHVSQNGKSEIRVFDASCSCLATRWLGSLTQGAAAQRLACSSCPPHRHHRHWLLVDEHIYPDVSGLTHYSLSFPKTLLQVRDTRSHIMLKKFAVFLPLLGLVNAAVYTVRRADTSRKWFVVLIHLVIPLGDCRNRRNRWTTRTRIRPV